MGTWLPLYRVTGDKLFCLCIVVGIVCPMYFVARCMAIFDAFQCSNLMLYASRLFDAVCIALGIGPSFDAVCIAFV